MASLRKENDRGRIGWKIRYRDDKKKQRVVWLGQCSKKAANDAFRHINELVSAKANGGPPTMRRSDGLRNSTANCGIVWKR
ncbi:MAG: hypothetical protein F9B45_10305 [Phycisphaera sp. RhM]|nr:hypothetical protein [Phycisphaera sp. RhM]